MKPLPSEIDFTPLVQSHRHAKSQGVPQEEIERSLDQFLADARRAVLAEDKHLTWAFIYPGAVQASMGHTYVLYGFGWRLRIRRRSDRAMRTLGNGVTPKRWLVSLTRDDRVKTAVAV
jgi:hypothetical protein